MDEYGKAAFDAPAVRSGFELFDLTVQLGPGLVPWVSAVSRLGHVHGIPRRDSGVPPIDDLLDSVYDYVDAVRFAEVDPEPSLARDLGHLVFGEASVLELFQATRGAAADRGREVLVRILASPHLAVLPWELLPDPARQRSVSDRGYLALAPDASVTRLARGRTYPIRSERLEPPLNLLIVVSSPIARDPADDSLAFDIYEEKRSLMAELMPLVESGLLHVEVEEQPSLENLRRRIGAQRRGYHVIHYLGHALPDRLILEDEQGRRDDQSGARFTEILRLSPDLRLAIFAGCETARAPQDPIALDAAATGEWRDLFSLADRAVQESCPMVVGMQAVLPFRTERLFTRFFYQGLVSGYSVTGAMRLARGATRGDRHVGGHLLDWSVPVLFLGGSDPGPLLDRSAVGKPPVLPSRHVLRLGLNQRETRFFARDVPLRQAIDVLEGNALERVLVVTGPSGVGKTFLIDRALEELKGAISILYLRFNDLVPDFDVDESDLLRTDGPVVALPPSFSADAVHERLCQLVADLLSREDGRDRARPIGGSETRWAWLVEDVTARHFVIVIDKIDLLTTIEESFVRRLVPCWLASVLKSVAQDSDKTRELSDLLDELIEALRVSTAPSANSTNPWLGRLPEFWDMLPRRRRSMTASRTLAIRAQKVLERLQANVPIADVISELEAVTPDESQRAVIAAALKTIVEINEALNDALQAVARRRSPARLAVVGSELPEGLLKTDSEWVFEMRLGHLTWTETYRWIRRNLPGLLRYGEEYLCRMWSQLGPELELWEELERRVLLTQSGDAALERIAAEIAPRKQPGLSSSGRSEDLPRGKRPLRVAAAGPHWGGPEAMSRAVTRLAAMHGVGGRVIPAATTDVGSLAVLIDEPTPFGDSGTALESDIFHWLDRVIAQRPDVVLLDYGAWIRPDETDLPDRRIFRALRNSTLLIAAGGNQDMAGMVIRPAIYEEVLSVGPITDEGRLQSYGVWWPTHQKPNLFMSDQLFGTPFEEALNPTLHADLVKNLGELGPGTHGASFAALNAVAAAVLVWATLPELSPRGVRRILEKAAKDLDDPRARGAKRLLLTDALKEARRELVRRTLASGPCSFQALAAITGLDPAAALETLIDLEVAAPPQIRRLPRGRLERYELTIE